MHFKRGICVGMLLVSAVWAADTTAPQEPRVYTTGVDARTGKLVRVPATRYSKPVSSRTLSPKLVPPASPAEKVVQARVIEPLEPGSETARPAAYRIPTGLSFDQIVEHVAHNYQISPAFVHAVIKAESNYNPRAISSKGALGLMQLMPQTARRFGVANAFNAAQNLEGGVRYLRYLLDRYADDGNQTALSLAAYNAGEGAVERFGGVPPYGETRTYLRRVNQWWNRYQTAVPSLPAPAPKKLEGPRIHEIVDASGATRYVTEPQ